MHPALSVLFFTVLSGAGYGLFVLLVLGHLTGLPQLQNKALLISANLVAFLLISGGLMCAFGHLANPKNFWRAFNRFKTSWLSREGVFSILFYPFMFIYVGGIWSQGAEIGAFAQIGGVVAAVLALVTLFCTSMIYASLKTIRQWNTSLTPMNYLALGLMSGALLLLAIQAVMTGEVSGVAYQSALGLLALGAATKIIYLFWIGKPDGSTINTATGFTQASVRLLDQGHSSNSFLNNEFGYTVEANKIVVLRAVMIGAAFVVPFLFLLAGNGVMAVVASVVAIAGLLLERWLFFAEARHVVRLYHGDQTT